MQKPLLQQQQQQSQYQSSIKMGSEANPKQKILCLHGRGTGNDIFKFQIRPLTNKLNQKFEFIYLEGQVECGAAPGVHEVFQKNKYFGYMDKRKLIDEDVYIYEKIDEAIEYVINFLKNSEFEFDGWLGFSQGANLMTMVYSKLKQTDQMELLPKFLVLFCGSEFGWANDQKIGDEFENKLLVRSFHVIGAKDSFQKQSHKLLKLFDENNLKKFEHSDDHRPLPKMIDEKEQLMNEIENFMLQG
eukprot:TRINITY_DN28077_c0_g2_i1.p1 TRINITY_DN28077_c0_g2~~TRINITY_DN28077_c0_g2_i1.p1  ORF type:complete len:244 (-),score=48.40 TRINITY_DN28077_c0_g2_i1:369-1100(-)